MQIVGKKCKVCGSNITLSSEGKYCNRCGTTAHLVCEPSTTCTVCGQACQLDQRPEPDPLRDALLPAALRPRGSGGPGFAIAVGFTFLLLAIIIWCAIEYAVADGY